MKQRDIILVNLNPGKGNEQKGIRPCVVISGNLMNKNLKVHIVCPLSTKIKNYPGTVFLKANSKNKLPEDSEILTFQIRTISSDRVIKKLGKISREDFKSLLSGLADIIKY